MFGDKIYTPSLKVSAHKTLIIYKGENGNFTIDRWWTPPKPCDQLVMGQIGIVCYWQDALRRTHFHC